jgi:hypothetical protein
VTPADSIGEASAITGWRQHRPLDYRPRRFPCYPGGDRCGSGTPTRYS